MRLDRLREASTSPLRRFLPLAMPQRSSAVLFFGFDVPADPIEHLLERYEGDEPLTLFHVVLAAVLRTLVERPQLNRTVLGSRIFERDALSVTFSVKQGKRDGSRLVSTKVVFDRADTLFDVQSKVNEAVRQSRDRNRRSTTERELELVDRLPRFVARGILRSMSALQRLGWLPEGLTASDPTHTSAFVANLGSIGLDASFHHLSDLGTASVHATVGRRKPAVVVEDGCPVVRDVFTVRVAIDDRIVDGFYCAQSLLRFEHWLTHPEALAEPWPDRTDVPVALLWHRARETPEAPAYWLRSSTEEDWFPTSWVALWIEVRTVARAWIELGVEPGDRVGIQGGNRPEWTVSYLAAQAIGAVPCGLHEDLPPGELTDALHLAAPRVVVLETTGLAASVRAALPSVELVTMERESDDAIDWTALQTLGARHDDGEVERRLRAIDARDPAVAVFTSGSSGAPRAALLSHASLLWTARTASEAWGARPSDRGVSYLPMSHVAEQSFTIVGSIVTGVSVAYAPSRAGLVDTLREFRPTILFGVPQIWERLKREIGGHLADAGLDRVRIAVSGAGALRTDLFEWYRSRGLVLLQTYGQTEGCGPTTLTVPGQARPGTVGPAMPGVDVRLVHGEVCFRGPNTFLGYLDDPVATAGVLRDGWVHSGDLAEVDGSHLVITGRKKAVVVPTTGENVASEPIERALEAAPLVGRAVVIGDDRPHLAALITLDAEEAVSMLVAAGSPPVDRIHCHPGLLREIQRVVDDHNARASRPRRIHRFAVLPGAFAPETGELTPTLKLRRAAIEARWASRIEALYADSDRWDPPAGGAATGFVAGPQPQSGWDTLFALRHDVFAEAGHLAPGHFRDARLCDGFDEHAVQFGVWDAGGALAGTMRFVPATGPLPVESLFAFEPVDVPRERTAEIGRLAMARAWRLRRAPVVTLIQAALDHALEVGISHVYAFVPARSVRMYSALGLAVWELPTRAPGPEHLAARAGMAPYFANQDPRVVMFTHPGCA